MFRRHATPARNDRPAFTLVEVIVSGLVLALLAGGTISALSATAKVQQFNADRTRARFLADDLSVEISKLAYVEETSYGGTLGPESGETNGANRELFDDVDDYNALTESPPKSRDGKDLTGLAGWTRQTRVAWVSTADAATASASETYLKKITVTVSRKGKPLATAVTLRSAASDKGRGARTAVVGNETAAAAVVGVSK